MSDKFNWYSEEDAGWDEKPVVVASSAVKPGRLQRGLLVLLLVAASLGLGGALAYRQLSQRVVEVSNGLEAEIRAGHSVIYQAARQRDQELFTTLLSGRDGRWASAQERLVRAGLFYDRPDFELVWRPGDAETAVSNVETSPDLTKAELTSVQSYTLDVGNGLTREVLLQHTAVYRLGPNRWLFSPPDDEFWGATQTSEGSFLTLIYPERDAAISRRLAADLEAGLNEMCARLSDIQCGNLHVTARLTGDPATLDEANHLFPDLRLPTPTLVGVPLDELGYQALYRGYARRILSSAITRLAHWQCCQQAVIFQALLDVQLAQLGLKTWPGDAIRYDALFQDGVRLTEVYQDWYQVRSLTPVAEAWPVYALAEFFTRDVGVSAAAMQRQLAREGESETGPWLQGMAAPAYPTRWDLERGWLRFIYGRSRAAQSPPPIPLPEQELQLACRPNDKQDAFLYRYDLASGSLELERALGHETALLLALPDGSGVIVSEQGGGSNLVSSDFVWRAGQETLIARAQPGRLPPIPLAVNPSGNVALFNFPNHDLVPYTRLALDSCLETADCELQSLLGAPTWSPDGARTILVGNSTGDGENLIFVGDSDGENVELVGQGTRPFWLDDHTIGYVVGGQEVVTADLATQTTQPLLNTQDLAVPLPRNRQNGSSRMIIDYVAVSPKDPNVLLLSTIDPIGNLDTNYIFTYDQQIGEVALRVTRGSEQPLFQHSYGFSPDGRWFVSFGLNNSEFAWTLFLYDAERDEVKSITLQTSGEAVLQRVVDWSADGQWLLALQGGYVRLLAPDADYETLFVPDRMACTAAVWVNRS